MKVYIAGPYTADTPEQVQDNVNCAVDLANDLLDAGHIPFCPHLTHYLHQRRHREYEAWCCYDLVWLISCDALLRMPGPSPGADRETRFAIHLGIPCFASLSDFLSWAKLKETKKEI